MSRKRLPSHRSPLYDLLFNCQPGNDSPDFRLFDAVEVRPSRDAFKGRPEVDGTCFEPCEPEDAEIWSVFGHFAPTDHGQYGLDCLTDCPTQELAEAIGVLFDHLIRESGK